MIYSFPIASRQLCLSVFFVSHSMSQIRQKTGNNGKHHEGQWQMLRWLIFISFTSVSLSNSTQTEWCLSAAWTKTDGKLPTSGTSRCVIASHKKRGKNLRYRSVCMFPSICQSELEPINTRDYCRAIWLWNECWLYPFPLRIKDSVKRGIRGLLPWREGQGAVAVWPKHSLNTDCALLIYLLTYCTKKYLKWV